MYNILICCLFCLFYEMRIKTIPKHVQLVPEKYRSIFVANKIAGKNTAIDGEIRRLPALNENTVVLHLVLMDLAEILVIKSALTFKTVLILYITFDCQKFQFLKKKNLPQKDISKYL